MGRCREVAGPHGFRFKNKLLSLDATLIEVCASVFDWAQYRRTKGAVKRKRPAELSITHKLSTDDGSQFYVGQASQASPHDFIAGWRVVGTREVAAEVGRV
ncbi:MAG: hypothetical protein WCF26_19495 [Candidatus Sulfotelmatobacter sp.]